MTINLSNPMALVKRKCTSCSLKPGLHVRRKHKHKRIEIVPLSCACTYACVVVTRSTCKPERSKHKHKRKHKALMRASHQFTRRFLVLMLVLMLILASFVLARL